MYATSSQSNTDSIITIFCEQPLVAFPLQYRSIPLHKPILVPPGIQVTTGSAPVQALRTTYSRKAILPNMRPNIIKVAMQVEYSAVEQSVKEEVQTNSVLQARCLARQPGR